MITDKKISQMTPEEFRLYIDHVRQQVRSMTTEEASKHAHDLIDNKDHGSYIALHDEDATT